MTLREEIQERIAKLDDAVLPDVLLDLKILEERRNTEFPQDFLDMLNMLNSDKANGLTGEEAMKIATEAVKADRQSHRG